MANRKHYNLPMMVAGGYISDHTFVHKFGANFDIDNNSEPESVWTGGGLYPWSAFDTAGVLVVVSDDTDDDVGEAGATEIVVEGLDEDYNLVTETFTMDGTDDVTGTKTFKRVFRAYVTAGATNAGNITVSRGGTVVAQIDEGRGQTLMAVYTIPAGYTGYLLCGDFSVQKNKDAQVLMYVRPSDGVFRIAHMAEVYESTYRYDFPIPLPIQEKSDMDIRADHVVSNNTRVTCNFDILLVENDET